MSLGHLMVLNSRCPCEFFCIAGSIGLQRGNNAQCQHKNIHNIPTRLLKFRYFEHYMIVTSHIWHFPFSDYHPSFLIVEVTKVFLTTWNNFVDFFPPQFHWHFLTFSITKFFRDWSLEKAKKIGWTNSIYKKLCSVDV